MSEEKKAHVVVLPWLAFGHMIPFLDLSIALARFNIHVSYISTPRNISRLPKIPPNLSKFINFVPIPLPTLHPNPLPENSDATIDIPLHRMDDLKEACDLLQDPIRNLIAEISPDWLMVDFFHHWAVDISKELNVPLITYSIAAASSSLVFFWTPEFIIGDGQRQARPSPQDMTVPPDWVDFPSQVACKHHEAEAMHDLLYGAKPSGIPDGARLSRLLQGSHAIAIRTCMELESEYLDLGSKITGKPVFPVGFLPPEKVEESRIITQEPWSKIFTWLDQQRPRSIVFIGFGSEYKLQKEEIHEIAHGIELSGLPFLFSLQKPEWGGDQNEVLPRGFEARTQGRGFVEMEWAPQREILAHPSIGGSLFHAGWGSIVENMAYGNYLVLLPFIINQPLETRLLVEKGLAIEVERAEDGSFTRNGIANALQKAMVGEEGEELRSCAKEFADGVVANRELNDGYVKKFAEYLKYGVEERK